MKQKKIFLKNIIDKLGGVVSIGEVLASGKAKEISNELDKKTIYYGKRIRLNYIVFNFNGVDFEDISILSKTEIQKRKFESNREEIDRKYKIASKENLFQMLLQEI